MFSIKRDVKEPIQQASLASVMALGIALIALGLAMLAMSKSINSKSDDTWREVTD